MQVSQPLISSPVLNNVSLNHFSDQYYEEHPKIFSRAPPPNPQYVLLAPLAHSSVIIGELTGKIKSPVNPMKKKNTEIVSSKYIVNTDVGKI